MIVVYLLWLQLIIPSSMKHHVIKKCPFFGVGWGGRINSIFAPLLSLAYEESMAKVLSGRVLLFLWLATIWLKSMMAVTAQNPLSLWQYQYPSGVCPLLYACMSWSLIRMLTINCCHHPTLNLKYRYLLKWLITINCCSKHMQCLWIHSLPATASTLSVCVLCAVLQMIIVNCCSKHTQGVWTKAVWNWDGSKGSTFLRLYTSWWWWWRGWRRRRNGWGQ